MATMQETVQEALDATAGQPPEVQAAAVRAAIPPPTGGDVNWLWKALVTGLILLLVLSLIGVMWAVIDGDDDTSPDTIVTLFTAVLTGLIGLFVKSPVQS
jgi:hypothetical protein